MSRRRRGVDITGVLLLDKPLDLSSNHALQRAKRLFNARKAGHTGTLDPFATGLLICCFGQATKLATTLLDADKRYRATLKLGVETDSGDLTGTVTAQGDAETVTLSQLHGILPQFTGQIEQIPPMHSALKRDGVPLYKLARQGVEVARPPRQVTIYAIELVAFEGDQVVLDVHCSKGTYIRTLAQDIGRALDCYAHLTSLRRTAIGPFTLEQAVSLEQLAEVTESVETSEASALATLKEILIPLSEVPRQWLPEKLLTKEKL